MEEGLSQLSTTIITFSVLLISSYALITLTVHLGLKSIIVRKDIRQGIVQLLSVVAFAVIATVML